MNVKDFYLAIGGVDDQLILDANRELLRGKKKNRIVWMAAVACACLVCFLGMWNTFRTTVYWNESKQPVSMKTVLPENASAQMISEEEAESYYRVSTLPEVLFDGQLEKLLPLTLILYQDADGKIVYDQNQVWYQNADSGQFVCITMARVTREQTEMENTRTSRIAGTSVILAVPGQENGQPFYEAQWQKNGTIFSVTASGMEKEGFLKILKELL